MSLTQPCWGSALPCVLPGLGNFPLSLGLLLVFGAIFSSLLISLLFTLGTNLDYTEFSQRMKGL